LAQIPADHASERPDPDEDQGSSSRRNNRQQSIKRRVVQLVLVPSAVALLLWFGASAYLVFQGYYNRAVAVSVRQVSIPAVSALSSLQQERRLSIAYLSRSTNDLNALLEQRRQTDAQLTQLRDAAAGALANAPDSIVNGWNALSGYLDQLPSTRSAIDAKTAGPQRAYQFYNELLDSATSLFEIQARGVPDAQATQGGLTATNMFIVSDLMSRSASVMEGAFSSGSLNQSNYLEYVRLIGSYHFELDESASDVQPDVKAQLDALRASDAWKQLISSENSIVTGGPWRDGLPNTVSVSRDRWTALTGTVSDALINLTTMEADQVSQRTLHTGNNQLLVALLGSLLALSVAIAAILWAVRQSRVLVDRALSVRLAKLGSDADAMVDQRLPAIMERLRHREPVDLATEFASQNYGSDEIGQVADVINRSLQVAAGAAVNEAKARAAGTAMLMGVARRPQRPLQRGLKVVEDLQNTIGDEKLLTQLFDIHHQLNQTRRFLENLVILAGGQIGRRFQNPVPLRRVLLASFAEARNYQRITLRSASDVSLVGHAVAEVIHLMAELLDNALAFSPPGTTVWVTSSQVNAGVAVEIEDAGVGMSSEAVDRANTLLATAPTPDVTELRDGAQVGLHVVAELAKREGIQVTLRKSAYGGLLTIVLLPERVLVAGNGLTPERPDRPEVLQQHPAPSLAAPREEPRREDVQRGTPRTAPVSNRSAVGILDADAGRARRPENTGGIVSSYQPGGNAGPEKREPTAPTSPAVGTASPGAHAVARPPLPHRRPQQHLAPGLRDDETTGNPAASSATRSPDEARARFARYQQGWADGQAASSDETTTNPDQGRNA
jgi:signal transduction histidine kinase